MGRFLFGVLFAFGLWWGYDRFLGSGAEAAGPPGHEAAPASASGDEGGSVRAAVRQAAVAPLAEVPENGGGGSAVVPDAARTAPGQPGDFATLRRLDDGAERDRFAAALVRAVRGAESPEVAVAVLGPTNDFLHTAEGRGLAEEVTGMIETLPARRAVAGSTRLMEAAMNGSIERADEATRAAFDRLAERHARHVYRTAFSPNDTTSARRYEVQSGENLIGIARHLRKTLGVRIEAGTLQVVNRISNPRGLFVGQVLKCPVEPIRTVVHKRSFVVAVYVGDVLVRTYWCAHGKSDAGGRHETPEATFVVGEKIENPDWHYGGRVIPFGDPENPLGTRFVRFDHESYSGFGIHGTNDPASIGTRASLGCIRLAEDDIHEFFLLVPRGTEVEIRA